MTQRFTDPIVCQISNDGKKYTLTHGFTYYRKNDKAAIIIVPEGYSTDGFTNGGLNFVVQKFGKGLKCAILHDYLCDEFKKGNRTRKFADEVFLEAMLETKAFWKIKAYFLYYCVRTFAILAGMK